MNARAKYIILLVVKGLTLFIAIFITITMTTLVTGFRSGRRVGDATTDETITLVTNNDAKASYSPNNNGELEFEIENNVNYDDISISFHLQNITFNGEVLKEMFKDEEVMQPILEKYENGPWDCTFKCNIQERYSILSFNNGGVSANINGYGYTDQVIGRSNDRYITSDIIHLEKGGELNVTMTFGSAEHGPIKDGKYVLFGELSFDNGISGLSVNIFKINGLRVLTNGVIYSVPKIQITDFFRIYSLLMIIVTFYILTIYLFLWRDLCVFWYVFKAVLIHGPLPGSTLVQIYSNNVFVGEYVDWSGSINGFLVKLIMALTIAGIVTTTLMMTAPIRFVIAIVRNIKGIITDNEDILSFSILANTFGPVGVLLLGISGFLMMFSSIIPGLISFVVGLGMLVGSIILQRHLIKKYS